MRMEALLQQPKQLANFVQYMKSISCSTTMTVLLLMFEVVNKIETECVSPALCQRLKVPLRQLLHLLHSGRVLASEDLDYSYREHMRHNHWDGIYPPKSLCSLCGRVIAPPNEPQLPPLLGLPPRLTVVIAEAIDFGSNAGANADLLYVARLVHTPEWTSAYKTMCTLMETLYLPTFMESPEYLGKMGVPSADSTPKHRFFVTDDPTSNFVNEHLLNVPDSPMSSRFYKAPKQSSSFGDINELNRRGAILHNGSIPPKVDNSSNAATPTLPSSARVSGRLRFRRRAAPVETVMPLTTSEAEDTVLEMEELDFSKWRVSIPFYVPSSSSHAPISIGGSKIGLPGATTMMKMASGTNTARGLEQPDFSLFSSTASNQGFYVVVAEREVGEKKVISRVNRKYAEFFVLEQRLVEFHGSQISRGLRARRFGSQPPHFLENMRFRFESFLRDLLAQPFLRTSELMYTFLTFPHVEFTSSNLPDIRLGKFVKSVPILLAKEKGQFTDEFLTAFRSSCFVTAQNASIQKVGNSVNHGQMEQTKHSILEHRLHSKIYWNNAGISATRRRGSISEYCAMEGSYVTSFYDFFGYLVDNFPKPVSSKKQILSNESAPVKRPRSDSTTGGSSAYLDFILRVQRFPLVCWNTLKTILFGIICALERKGLSFVTLHLSPRLRSSNSFSVTNEDKTDRGGITTYLPGLLRRAILNVGLALRATEFRDLVDLHMRRKVEHFLHLLVRNDYLAPMLMLLHNSIFFPAPPRSEQEKIMRRKKVYDGLRQLINRFHLQWFSEDEMLQRRLGHVFEVFQHGKWNKQLIYTLLDHILLELFPDVFASPKVTKQ